MVHILTGGDDPAHVAFAELVGYGTGKTPLRVKPWISITNIRMIDKSAPALRLAGTMYDIYLEDKGLAFMNCMAANSNLTGQVKFLAKDIVDEECNSIIE